MACGSFFDRPRRHGRYQRRTSDAYTECGSFFGANDQCYRLFTRNVDEGRQAGNCVRPCPSRLEPVMMATQVSEETSPQPRSLTVPKIVSRHWHDHTAKKLAAVSPDRRIKILEPKNGKNIDRAKATVDLRPCRRPEGFAGLLRALNLSPGCDS